MGPLTATLCSATWIPGGRVISHCRRWDSPTHHHSPCTCQVSLPPLGCHVPQSCTAHWEEDARFFLRALHLSCCLPPGLCTAACTQFTTLRLTGGSCLRHCTVQLQVSDFHLQSWDPLVPLLLHFLHWRFSPLHSQVGYLFGTTSWVHLQDTSLTLLLSSATSSWNLFAGLPGLHYEQIQDPGFWGFCSCTLAPVGSRMPAPHWFGPARSTGSMICTDTLEDTHGMFCLTTTVAPILYVSLCCAALLCTARLHCAVHAGSGCAYTTALHLCTSLRSILHCTPCTIISPAVDFHLTPLDAC